MMGHNTMSNRELMSFIERVERLEAEKKQTGEDIKAVFAEAKATGFVPKYMKFIIKRRAAKPADVQEHEAMMDTYLHAAGLAKETPLFRHVGTMSVDRAARDQVIAAFKELVPDEGEIIVKMGGQPVRLWRDKKGVAQAEDYQEPPVPAAPRPGSAPAARPTKEVPDVDEAGARDLGRTAARENQPIVTNPFPWDDKRRRQFDEGWREVAGSDGMGPEDE